MLHRPLFRFGVIVAGLGLAVSSFACGAQDDTPKRGRKYKAPPPTAHIEVTILRNSNSKPIENAAVIFHPMEGEKDKGNMELKTNEDGKTIIDVMPIGDTIRLQVIAPGFQTYGADYKIDKAEMAFEIKMKRPGEQYSIYKDHSGSAQDSKDKPSGSSSQPDSQSNPNQPPPQAK
jgi:hypothetical protein